MDDLALLVALVVMSLGVLMLLGGGLRKTWRGRTPLPLDHKPAWWLYGEVSWRGVLRAVPAGSVGFVFLTVGAWIVVIYRNNRSSMPVIVEVAFWIVVAGWVLSSLTMVSTFLFARPKGVIPPHLRDRPSAVTEWRRELANRQSD